MSARGVELAAVRSLVRARLEDGRLPRGEPGSVWGGYGSGRTCVVCERSILAEEIEYELVFRTAAHEVTVRMHIACYGTWQLETRGAAPAGP